MKKQLLLLLTFFGSFFLFDKSVTAQTYVTNGLATLTDASLNEYRLTLDVGGTIGYGTVWYQNKIDLRNDFTVTGQINLGLNDGFGADGIAFVLQPLSVNAGGAGGGIGYFGVSPSFEVEFDTWQNTDRFDPPGDHTAIQINGDVTHDAAHTLAGPTEFSTNIEDGAWHDVKFTWTAATKNFRMYWNGSSTPFYDVIYDISANVFSGSPYVYFGFTAAVGSAVNEQSVRISNAIFVSEGVEGAVKNASCSTATDGAVNITATGLTAPVTYLWSNGAATEDVSGLLPGTYTVTVTDAATPARSIVSSFTVGADQVAVTPTVSIAISTGTMPVCQGESLSFTATATNGGSNPTYEWTINYGGNSVVIGTDPTLTYNAFSVGGAADRIQCKLISNAACAVPTEVMSNSIEIATTYGTTWYLDADGDHYYTGSPVAACSSPGTGYTSTVIQGGDCNDDDDTIYPGATEICGNYIDDNCNGQVDEGCTAYFFYEDADDDFYGNGVVYVINYTGIPPAGYVSDRTDCNDRIQSVHPGATEICGNGIDDNCNGQVDEGCSCSTTVTICDASIKEGNSGTKLLSFPVRLSKAATASASVKYKTSNGTAIANSDYRATEGTLTFSAGQTVKYATVVINGDVAREANETFYVTLEMPVNLKFGSKKVAKALIYNDDMHCKKDELHFMKPKSKVLTLKVPNLLHRGQLWVIPDLPVANKIIVYNTNGAVVFNATNYGNNKSFFNTAAGMYFYQIFITNENGEQEIVNGKIVITD